MIVNRFRPGRHRPREEAGTGNVVIDGSAVSVTATTAHDGFPGLTRLTNDNLLVIYRQGTSHTSVDGVLRAIVLDGDGAVLSGPSTILTPTDDVRGAMLATLANGRVGCTFWESDGATDWTSRFMLSTDATATAWGTPVDITTTYTEYGGAIECAPVELPNGDLLVALYGKNSADTYQSIRASRSTDGGATWADDGEIASGDDYGRDLQEPTLLTLDDGRLLCMVRSDATSPNEWIMQTYSLDGGATWLDLGFQWVGTGRPSTVQRSDGALVCAYRTTPDDDFRFRTSWNGGESWTGTDGDLTGGSGLFFAYAQWAVLATGQVCLVYSLEQASATDADLWFAKLAD